MPSYVVLDYDNDTIEVKKWGVIRYDLTRCHGLSKAKAVKIVCDSSGDSGYTITKYLVFNDGEEIELPEWSKDIEHLLTRWYEQYFHVQLPVLEEGFTKGLLSKRRAQ